MNTITLSSCARTRTLIALAGLVTAGTLATAGSAGAASPTATDSPRITVTNSVVCSGGQPVGIEFFYDDHVDGHVPLSVSERIYDGAGEVFARDELHQVNGDYFNSITFPNAGQTLNPTALYTYTVMITYDDGMAEMQESAVDLSGACPATPPTSAAPAPEPDRFVLTEGLYGCGTTSGAFLEWSYGDYPDGHYAQSFSLDLLRNGELVEHHTAPGGDPSSDGAVTMFDVRPDGNPGLALDPFFDGVTLEPASYSLSITVTYDDGATDRHIVTFDLDDRCNGVVNGRTATPPTTVAPTTAPANSGATTTTTVPTGTLPATGASGTTWVIGAIAGLLLTCGAVVFATGRSRAD